MSICSAAASREWMASAFAVKWTFSELRHTFMRDFVRRFTPGPVTLFTLFASLANGLALSLTNPPSADTSLIEVAPDNSNGGQAWVLSARTQNGPRTRALYRSNLAELPTNT